MTVTDAEDDELRLVADDPERPLAERLAAHVELGTRLGRHVLARGQDPGDDDPDEDPDDDLFDQLVEALERLRLGVEGNVVDDEASTVLVDLLLLAEAECDPDPSTAVELLAEAHDLLLDRLAGVEPASTPALRSLLARLAQVARRQWARAMETDDADGGRTALDQLVDVWEQLFTGTPPTDPDRGTVTMEFVRALSERAVTGGARPGDEDTLLRILQGADVDVATGESLDEEAVWTALVAAETLGTAYESRDDIAFLTVGADLLDRARAGAPSSRWSPLIDAMLGNLIANAPDGAPLAGRLDEAEKLLAGALERTSAEDRSRAQMLMTQAILLQRRQGSSDETTALVLDLTHAVADLTEGAERSLALANLGGLFDRRFQTRRDVRDARAALARTEAALTGFTGTEYQRSVLLLNRAVGLLRLLAVEARPELLVDALGAIDEARRAAPEDRRLRAHLEAVGAAALWMRAAGATDAAAAARDRRAAAEALRTARTAAGEDATVLPLIAGVSLALDVAMSEDVAGERADLRVALAQLDDVMASDAGRGDDSLQAVRAVMVSHGVRTGQLGADDVEPALAALAASRERQSDMFHPVWSLLAMNEADLLRARDDLSWRAVAQDRDVGDVSGLVDQERLARWLAGGGSDISAIKNLVATGTSRAIGNRPDRRRARELGLTVLRMHAARVLLQAGTADAIATAQTSAGDAHQVAGWCLADSADDEAVTALETGRAVSLWAAGMDAVVPDHLRAVGEPDLADAWEASSSLSPEEVPSDVRHRALDRLAARGLLGRLVSVPDAGEVGGLLRDLGCDAMVYLLPAGRGRAAGDEALRPLLAGVVDNSRPGALIVSAGGSVRWRTLPELSVAQGSPVRDYLAAYRRRLGGEDTATVPGADARSWRAAVEDVCAWAWATVIEPLEHDLVGLHAARRPRVVLVPVDALSVVPWHAAFPPEQRDLPPERRRHALSLATFSYAASASVLMRAAARPIEPLGARVLLAGVPGDGLPYCRREVGWLKAGVYPDAVVWRGDEEGSLGAAVPKRLRTAVADGLFSLIHYAGHAAADTANPGASALLLSPRGAQMLRAATIARMPHGPAGYGVCLAACTTHAASTAFDEAFTLATAFMTGGASTVIGSLWRLDDAATAVLSFMLHRGLARGERPAEALHAAQRWMVRGDRRLPSDLPPDLVEEIRHLDLSDPLHWAGFTHQGR